MAATKRNAMLIDRALWRFYVYALTFQGVVVYVGKGSGHRLKSQCAAFGVEGHELARFKREADAYKFEVQAIVEYGPWLNQHRGGNGSFAIPKRPRRLTKVETEIASMGTRLYAINLLRRFGYGYDLDWGRLSKVEAELRAANG